MTIALYIIAGVLSMWLIGKILHIIICLYVAWWKIRLGK